MEETKIYELVQLTRDKVLVITMSEGVRVILIDLKRRSRVELKGLRDTNKLRLMPYFDMRRRPLALAMRYEQAAIRNLQNHEITVRVRDVLQSADGLMEPMMETKEGVVVLR